MESNLLNNDLANATEEALRAKITRLNKIVQALMDRAESSAIQHGSDFNLFHTAITLEAQVRTRTSELNAALQETERVTRSLREREWLLRTLITNAPIGLAMFDRDMRYLAVSKCWMDDFSLISRDIIGKTQYEIFPEISEEWKDVHRRVLSGETIRSDEDPFERMDGTIQWLRWEVLPWYSGEETVGGIINFSEDITSFKEAKEEILRLNSILQQRIYETEEKYRILYESMDEGYCVAEMIYEATGKPVDFRFLEVNPAFEKHTGLKQVLGKTIRHMVPDHDANWFEIYGKVAQTGESIRFENPVNAMQRYFDVYAFRIGGNDSHKVGILFRDITERKKVETELRISSTAFESQESMIITDPNSVILRVNHAFTESTGYSAVDAVGKKPSILKSGHHDADFYREMWETLHQTGSWQGEIWDRRKNGEVFPKWLTISAVKGKDGVVTHYVGSHFDITERKRAEEQIKHLAFYDQLTNLPNRRLLLDRLQQAFTSSNRSRRKGALLFIDLDNFKTLNDTLGHDIGDLLLQQVAERLESCVREGDTVARLGGDEFVILLENLSKDVMEAASQAEVIGEKIINTLNQKYYLITHEHHNTPSIGITLFDEHQHSAEDLFKQADLAMYQSKKAGRNTLRFFDPKMQESINTQSSLESELRKAADEHQFQLYYQIQVDISNLPIGSEALIRWIHPERGLMLPMQFIPMAEESGLILSIGEWVLEAACEQLVKWSHHKETEHLIVAVNVSAHQFNQADFSDRVLEIIKRAGANPQRLKLEITESLLLNK